MANYFAFFFMPDGFRRKLSNFWGLRYRIPLQNCDIIAARK